ncbi:MAG TPA: BadF/BadG/BcrA/BcrD ATPase family protein [Fimbriimonadaceae bacterium]|nr:BadF/BadG/BcrA/BcrD ATPase family protein [Fimbriimonadaceae bacterium]
MPVFLGLDCGGSSCRALASDEAQNVLFRGTGGPANVATIPESRLRRSIERATQGAPPPDVVCGCFAGLLTANDRQRAISLLTDRFPQSKVFAFPDYAAALRAGGSGIDVCVVAGTGSLVCSLHEGKLRKSGGRGYLLGDRGSGFRFGLHALKHFLDYPESSTALVQAVEEAFGSGEEGEVLSKLYRSGPPAPLVAKLLSAYVADLKAGQRYAEAALAEEMSALATIASRHILENFDQSATPKVGLAGGVWKASSLFADAFSKSLVELIGKPCPVQRITAPPVTGALLLAMEMKR